MSLFRAIVFTAAAAGLLVGVIVTAAQHVGTVPLILQAEIYERQAEGSKAASGSEIHQTASHDGHLHAHAAPSWEPSEGLERNAYRALFNVVEWIGFGLCLAGALIICRRPPTWREGLVWGVGGFAAFTLAPGLGLPPELPGIPAAELLPRQIWWTGTAIATAGGLGLLAFARSPLIAITGAALIVAPHLIGAPHLDHVTTNVPAALSRQFVIAVTVTAFIAWTLLGALTGYFLRRFARGAQGRN